MFRGGSYVDRPEFQNVNKNVRDYMRTDDIDGAKPSRHFQSRNRHIGASILDIPNMAPAGGNKIDRNGPGHAGVAGLFSANYQQMDNRKGPLAVQDINGEVKRN